MKAHRLPEAFVPTARHYYRSPLAPVASVAGPVAEAVREGLYPAGFTNGAIDPSAVYPGLSAWDRLRVRQARSALWGQGQVYAERSAVERALAEAGL